MTFMNKVCRAANFRTLLRDSKLQQAIEEVIAAYDDYQTEDGRGTRISDDLKLAHSTIFPFRPSAKSVTFKQTKHPYVFDSALFPSFLTLLNRESGWDHYVDEMQLHRFNEQQCFLRRKAMLCSQACVNGVTFKAFNVSENNSNAIVRHDEGRFFAARIVDIVLHERYDEDAFRAEPFLVVQRLQSLQGHARAKDPYRRYVHAGGYLCGHGLAAPEVVRAEQLVSHFAKTPMRVAGIEEDCIHVLPLDRVSPTLQPGGIH